MSAKDASLSSKKQGEAEAEISVGQLLLFLFNTFDFWSSALNGALRQQQPLTGQKALIC